MLKKKTEKEARFYFILDFIHLPLFNWIKMNIKLIAIGKTDNKNLQSMMEEYQKRLSFYVKFDLEVIPDIKNVKNLSESQQKEKKAN